MDQDQSQDQLLKGYDVELGFDVDFGRYENQNVYCPHCEDPSNSTSQSCSVNKAGMYSCKSCETTGTVVDFYMARIGCTKLQSIRDLSEWDGQSTKRKGALKRRITSTETKRPLDESIATKCAASLIKHQRYFRYLTSKRGLTTDVLAEYEIGCDEYRITIPIRDEEGQLVNIRRYLPEHGNMPKMLSHPKGDGTPRLYPFSILDEMEPGDELIICEGEWDCLLLISLGFRAITNTGNVATWHSEWTQILKHYRCRVVFDVNDKDDDLGQRKAWEVGVELAKAGAEDVRVVRLPLGDKYIGGDVTNFFVDEDNEPDDLRNLIAATTSLDLSSKSAVEAQDRIDNQRPIEVTLSDAAKSEYYFKPIRVRCVVAGKGTSPYILPRKILAESTDDEGNKQKHVASFRLEEGVFISLVGVSDAQKQRVLRSILKIPGNSSFTWEVLESFNIEELYLIPAIDMSAPASEYVLRKSYFVGHGIETNRVYDFKGYTMPDPKSQQATHVLLTATPAETDIDRFDIDEDLHQQLAETFQTDDVFEKMHDIADHMSAHITNIYGRADLHIAVDLVFHSPLMFDFDGKTVKKGWLEALIIGDTRTGKGFVAEGLSKYYGVGDLVSGENLTLAGLIGGVQKLGDRFTLTWGKIPLADRRLVVMDECTGLSHSEIAKLSRIRSEGVAEVTKIISEKTTSRTRLIWLANPRPGPDATKPRVLSDYNYGIEAVSELIGAAEDVARFDFVLTVAQNEVKSEDINIHRDESSNETMYTQDICRKLLTWCWSRTVEDVIFDEDVVSLILKAAKDLGSKFSPKVCLIQAEDVRFKLARIAAASAGRTYSTDDGVRLLVRKEHVEFAYNFLHHIYSKPSCGYLQLSTAEREKSTLRDPNKVREILESTGEVMADLVDGLLEHRIFTARDICDYANLDIHQARMMISDLVRCRAVIKDYNGYAKRPSFRLFLQRLRTSMLYDQHVTQAPEGDDYDDTDEPSPDTDTDADADTSADSD